MLRKFIGPLFCLVCGISGIAHGGVLGEIALKDGSRLYGEILEMVDGTLKAKAVFSPGDPIPIVWNEVSGLETKAPITLVLRNGVIIHGVAKLGDPGVIHMATELLDIPIPVKVESVVAINPPVKKAITYNGNVNLGGSITTGNTDLRQLTFVGDLVIRGDVLRLSLLGRWIYSEDSGRLITRNAFGTIKLDYFFTKRFYLYTGALFEQDTFQDLQLRTSINAGPGYQFIEKGDYKSPYLKEMQFYGEVGIGFFNEDFKIAPDRQRFSGRWAANLDWPITTQVTVFHQHQGFPSLEDINDYYITSQQGIRIKFLGNFNTTFQVNWRYDNTPSPGKKSSDFQYLLTLGYHFES